MQPFQMSRQFVYSVHDLQTGGRDYESPVSPSWLRAALQGCDLQPWDDAGGVLRVRLSMSGRDVVVRGRLQVPIAVPCARCLQPVQLDVDAEVSLLLMPGHSSRPQVTAAPARSNRAGAASAEKAPVARAPKHPVQPGFAKGRWSREGTAEVYEFSQEEADIDTYDGDQVVLDDHVRELILLEAPIFPLCSEACPGIRAVPEQRPDPAIESDQIDPRLRPLLNLQKKKA